MAPGVRSDVFAAFLAVDLNCDLQQQRPKAIGLPLDHALRENLVELPILSSVVFSLGQS